MTQKLIYCLFFGAGLGIFNAILRSHQFDYQFLALGLLIFAIDQAKMAVLDLNNIAIAKTKIQDPRLDQFYFITISTITLELTGFYLAVFQLGWGILLVLGSQVWFNLLVNIRLQPNDVNPIQNKPISEKVGVLLADIVGMILIGVWMIPVAPLTIVITLWTIAIAYAGIKLFQAIQVKRSVNLKA
ncbi:MAG: hypothetical protein VKJ02_16825 [Snowella sp.]|nr:hypothetical protein [Snowella sp.]